MSNRVDAKTVRFVCSGSMILVLVDWFDEHVQGN
jgi:hypothetical protein